MSNDNGEHAAADRHLREAARWFVDLQDPHLAPEEVQRWKEWQKLAPNREAFDSLTSLWRVIHSVAKDIEPAATLADVQEESSSNLREEAAYWYFLCVDAPNGSSSDRRDFLDWMRRSPEHIAELLKIARIDGVLRGVKQAPARKHSFKLMASAVSLVAGAGLALGALHYHQSDQVIATGASQWHHMTLPDGTAVHVDAHSKVEVAYTDHERIVHVRAGSAVFNVVKDPRRPFIARTHLIDVTAVGTRFGVSIDSGVTTTVSEGVVKVTGRGRLDSKAVMLRAGEELRASNDTLTSPHFAHVDAARKLQWAQGLLDLSGMTVAEGVEELNRRNRIQIVVDNPTLGTRVVEVATVKVDSPETYARSVADLSGTTMIVDKDHGVIRLSE